jgi:hypothetical protein
VRRSDAAEGASETPNNGNLYVPNKKRPEKTVVELRKIASDALKEGRTLAQRNAQLVRRLEALTNLIDEHQAELVYRRRPRGSN